MVFCPVRRLAAQVDAARRVYRLHRALAVVRQQYTAAPSVARKAGVAENLAVFYARVGELLAGSWLARTVTFLPTPTWYQQQANYWTTHSDLLYRQAAAADTPQQGCCDASTHSWPAGS